MDDFEPPEFFNEVIHTARKQHQCCECPNKIEPGERYERVAGKWDGEFCEFKTCLPCAALRNKLQDQGYASAFGGLQEAYQEALRDDFVIAPVEILAMQALS